MGEILAREAPVDADLVIAVPDSGNPAARGYARAAGSRTTTASSRTATSRARSSSPARSCASTACGLKFNPMPEIVRGQRLVVVDDSIVRGNTTRQIVQMLRDAGAKEVHLRITAPPIRNPCHYGIDMSTREEMIAHGREIDEIAAELGADSLALHLAGGRLRGRRRHARDALRRLLHRRVPAARHAAGRAGQARVRAGAAGHTRVTTRASTATTAGAAIPADPGAMVVPSHGPPRGAAHPLRLRRLPPRAGARRSTPRWPAATRSS